MPVSMIQHGGASVRSAPTTGESLSVRIFGFDGPYDVLVLGSRTDDSIEAHDVETEDYVFFGDDGTIIDAAVRDLLC